MRNFVDEQKCPIKGENGYEGEDKSQRRILYQDSRCQSAIAGESRTDHVYPINTSTVIGDVLGQIAGSTKHRLVVGDLGQPARLASGGCTGCSGEFWFCVHNHRSGGRAHSALWRVITARPFDYRYRRPIRLP